MSREKYLPVSISPCNTSAMAREKKFSASEFGRRGGKARAEQLTKEQRKEIARKAAQARWAKKKPG